MGVIRSWRQWLGLGALSTLLFGGCLLNSEAPPTASCGDTGCGWEQVVATAFTTGPTLYESEIDILFVIDDTPAMAGVEAKLLTQLPVFAQVFQALPFGAPPMHVAFIPATVPTGDCAPASVRSAVCGIAAPDQFLNARFCGADTNSSGTVESSFACLGDLGAQGCGTAQPLEAARRALGGDPGGGALAGRIPFLTPGAALQIVFVTAQDDASIGEGALVPVSDYLTFFQGLTPNPTDSLLVSVIGPEGCPSDGPVPATSTPRLDQIVGAQGTNGGAASICDPFWQVALAPVASSSRDLLKPPCLAGIKDTDPAQAGLQPSCVIEDNVTEPDGAKRLDTIPICDPDAPVTPCLSLQSPDSFNGCPAGSEALVLSQGLAPDSSCGPYAENVRVTCQTCTDPNDPACAGL